MSDEEHPKDTTLTEFIEQNHRTVSTLGILTALAVFSRVLEPKQLGAMLSLALLTGSVLVWIELVARFPQRNFSWRLLWFEWAVQVSMIVFVTYWLLESRKVWAPFTGTLLFLLIFLGSASVLSPRVKRWPTQAAFPAIIVLMAVSVLLAWLLARPVDRLLDRLQASMGPSGPRPTATTAPQDKRVKNKLPTPRVKATPRQTRPTRVPGNR